MQTEVQASTETATTTTQVEGSPPLPVTSNINSSGSSGAVALTNAETTTTTSEQELQKQKQAREQKLYRKWNRRFKIFFCCLGYKKNKDSIADIASIFAEFYSDLNGPSSDVAAGFVLLSKYQAAQRKWILEMSTSSLASSPTTTTTTSATQPPHPPGLRVLEETNSHQHVDRYLSNIPISSETKFLDISTADDSHLINDLIYYMNYSLAIFGWPMQMVDDPCMLCCIYPYLRLSPCCSGKRSSSSSKGGGGGGGGNDKGKGNSRKVEDVQQQQQHQQQQHPIILDDNCCGCNAASFERRLAQHNYEIIYISYKSSVAKVPFLVAADHAKQTIVVAIRGSMSLSDMVTDMHCIVDKMPIENCPDDWLCHRGITRAAQYVKSSLLDERHLERAFECRPDLGSREYQLVLCGHSLGAGTAAILGVLMRPQFPTLRAYLYSPPGGILSMPVVEYTKQFAIGIMLGNDTVPRLGVAQLERLRYHVLLCLNSTKKSSTRIIARALCPSMCFGSNEVDYDPTQSIDLLHGMGALSFDYNGINVPFQVQPQVLYVPGKLIHVVKNYSFQSKTRRFLNGPIYQAIWTDNADYDRILISEGMFMDHLPNNLMHAMKMLFSKTLPARSATKEQLKISVKQVEQEQSSVTNGDAGNEKTTTTTTTTSCPVKQEVGVQTLLSSDTNCLQSEKQKVYDEEHERENRMAHRKNVIEDDNNNNNNNNNNHEDENNNNKLGAY